MSNHEANPNHLTQTVQEQKPVNPKRGRQAAIALAAVATFGVTGCAASAEATAPRTSVVTVTESVPTTIREVEQVKTTVTETVTARPEISKTDTSVTISTPVKSTEVAPALPSVEFMGETRPIDKDYRYVSMNGIGEDGVFTEHNLMMQFTHNLECVTNAKDLETQKTCIQFITGFNPDNSTDPTTQVLLDRALAVNEYRAASGTYQEYHVGSVLSRIEYEKQDNVDLYFSSTVADTVDRANSVDYHVRFEQQGNGAYILSQDSTLN